MLAATSAVPALAPEAIRGVEISPEHVSGAVHVLRGAGANIGVCAGEDGLLLVDDAFAPLWPAIRTALSSVAEGPIRLVVNTHWHLDHTGGNDALPGEAVILAHPNALRRRAAAMEALPGTASKSAPAGGTTRIAFEQDLTLHMNGEEVSITHHPRGHTDGDCVVHFRRANVVQMGDTFVTYGLPYVDVASGGSLLGMIDGVEQVMARLPDDVKVVPGHGPVSSKDDVRRFVAMLRGCVARVERERDRGLTLPELLAARVLEPYDHLGRGFVRTEAFTELVFTELELARGRAPVRPR